MRGARGRRPWPSATGWLARALPGLRLAAWMGVCLALVLAALPGPARAALDLQRLEVQRGEAGILVDYDLQLVLTPAVDEALHKGVPLFFEIEARLWRSRWYWRDRSIAQAQRSWRLAYQPLTDAYRLSVAGGGSQTVPTLSEALRVIQRGVQWRVAGPISADDEGHYYVEFAFRLDTTHLPRPLQFDVNNRADWALGVERTLPVPAPR